jgi:hypothetical protein
MGSGFADGSPVPCERERGAPGHRTPRSPSNTLVDQSTHANPVRRLGLVRQVI